MHAPSASPRQLLQYVLDDNLDAAIDAAKAFFGGEEGPNGGSPRGLLDIPGWEQMDKGEAAQALEVSAYPDRYRNYESVAETILTTLTGTTTTASAGASAGAS